MKIPLGGIDFASFDKIRGSRRVKTFTLRSPFDSSYQKIHNKSIGTDAFIVKIPLGGIEPP